MISVRRLLIVGAAFAAVACISGCGEKEQVIVYKQGKYQGKPDTKPWENDPAASLYTTSKWKAGDKSGWETALKSRNQNQNEYTRAE
jgi:hypothetical protein